MDSTTARLDFAAIGHQDSWRNVTAFVNDIRGSVLENLSCEKIKEIYSFIPPRELFRVKVRSTTGVEIEGLYVETFIDPDKLSAHFVRTNLRKVVNAISRTSRLGSPITTLGGFTSIVLEGDLDPFSTSLAKFTTGNTLTAAFIIKGIEKAADLLHIDLSQSNILVIGATGDIGLACTHYLKHKAKKLLLCARNTGRLEQLANDLTSEQFPMEYSADPEDLLPRAQIIISTASSSGIQLKNCPKNALICDAGYPKNLDLQLTHNRNVHLFHGGMGQVSGGFELIPDYSRTIYQHPAPYVIHGCISEAMVLAFEKRFENYSIEKGKITMEKIEEMYTLSVKHGIHLAPFYNAKGLWPD